MTVQIPTFRATIAEQMAAYRERLADRLDKELQKRGQDHHDLAHALRANPRTAERWVTGETEPQRRYRKPIADFLHLPIEDLWPDLESEDKAFKDWMGRIEHKLDLLLDAAGISSAAAAQAAEDAAAQVIERQRDGSGRKPAATPKKRARG